VPGRSVANCIHLKSPGNLDRNMPLPEEPPAFPRKEPFAANMTALYPVTK